MTIGIQVRNANVWLFLNIFTVWYFSDIMLENVKHCMLFGSRRFYDRNMPETKWCAGSGVPFHQNGSSLFEQILLVTATKKLRLQRSSDHVRVDGHDKWPDHLTRISRRMMNGEEFGSFLSQAAVVMLGALKSIAYQSADTAHFHAWDQEASSC